MWGGQHRSPLPPGSCPALPQERYIWSVIPSLLAWPLTAMQPGPAAWLLALQLGAAYFWDKRATARGGCGWAATRHLMPQPGCLVLPHMPCQGVGMRSCWARGAASCMGSLCE